MSAPPTPVFGSHGPPPLESPNSDTRSSSAVSDAATEVEVSNTLLSGRMVDSRVGREQLEVEAALDPEREQSFLTLSTVKEALDGDDWRRKVGALRQLDEALTEGTLTPPTPGELVPFMASVAETFRTLKDTKPDIPGGHRVTQMAAGVVTSMAKMPKKDGFCISAAAIIPDLLPFLAPPSREAVQEAVAGAIEAMLAECHSPGVLRATTVSLVSSKKAHLRRKSSVFLCVAIESWPKPAFRAVLPPAMGQMRKALFDADATVRREGRHTFAAFIKLWPAEGGGMYHALDRANQKAVLQEQPHVSNFVSSKNGSNASGREGSLSGPSLPLLGDIGGGGGQRPAGLTVLQNQQRNLLRWKLEREKERERERERERQLLMMEEDLAAASVVCSSAPNTPIKQVAATASNSLDGVTEQALARTSGIQSPRAGIAGGGVGVLRSPPGSAPSRSGSRVPNVSCSEGLRHAAKLALRRHDLLSPTMKKLLKEEANKIPIDTAAAAEDGKSDNESGNEVRQDTRSNETKATVSEAPSGREDVLENDDNDSVESAFRASPVVSPRSRETRAAGERESGDGTAIPPAELRQSTAGEDKEDDGDLAIGLPAVGEEVAALPSPLASTSTSTSTVGARENAFDANDYNSGSSGNSSSDSDEGEPNDRIFDDDESSGNNLGPTTRALFATDDGGQHEVSCAEEEFGRQEGQGSTPSEREDSPLQESGNSMDPPPPRPPSILPTLSALSWSDEPVPSPSAREGARIPGAGSSSPTRAPASGSDLAIGDGGPKPEGFNVGSEEHRTVSSADEQTPRRQGILSKSGESTNGKDTAASRRVRFRENIDTNAFSAAGSLNSPRITDGSKNRGARGWWSSSISDTTMTTESGGLSFADRLRLSWRSFVVNTLIVAATLGVFAVTLSVTMHNGVEHRPDPASPLVSTTTIVSSPAADVRRAISVHDQNNGLDSSGVGGVKAGRHAELPDSSLIFDDDLRETTSATYGSDTEKGTVTGDTEVAKPEAEVGAVEGLANIPVNTGDASSAAAGGASSDDGALEEGSCEATASTIADEAPEISPVSVSVDKVTSEADTVASRTHKRYASRSFPEAKTKTTPRGSYHRKKRRQRHAPLVVEGNSRWMDVEVKTEEIPLENERDDVTDAEAYDTRHAESSFLADTRRMTTTTPMGSYHSRKAPPPKYDHRTVEKISANVGHDGTPRATGFVPAAVPASTTTTPMGSYHRRTEPPQQFLRAIVAIRDRVDDGEASAAAGNGKVVAEDSTPAGAPISTSTTPMGSYHRRKEPPQYARRTVDDKSAEVNSDGVKKPESDDAGHADNIAPAVEPTTTTATPLGSYHRRKEPLQHARRKVEDKSAEVNSDVVEKAGCGDQVQNEKPNPPVEPTTKTTTTPIGSYHRRKEPPQYARHTNVEAPAQVDGEVAQKSAHDDADQTEDPTPAVEPTTTTPMGSFHRRKESPQYVRRTIDGINDGGRVTVTSYKNKRSSSSDNAPASGKTRSLFSTASLSPAASGWGWVEVWASITGAIVLFGGIFLASRGNRDGEPVDNDAGDAGAGSDGNGPRTPRGAEDEFGSYTTVELMKVGDEPATLRSVKRSRRISSAQKAARSNTVVMDLGATAKALNLN